MFYHEKLQVYDKALVFAARAAGTIQMPQAKGANDAKCNRPGCRRNDTAETRSPQREFPKRGEADTAQGWNHGLWVLSLGDKVQDKVSDKDFMGLRGSMCRRR